jgi:Fe-S cluster assembly protein SufD
MTIPAVLDPDSVVIRSLPECRAAAEERFNLRAWPSRTDETWRFADLKRHTVEGYSNPVPFRVEHKGPWDSVEILDLDTALSRHGDVFGPVIEETLGSLGSARHLAWGLKSEALAGECWVVPEGRKIADPLVASYRASGHGHAALLNLVLVRKGASVILWEDISSTVGDSVFVVNGTVVIAEEGAEVILAGSQELSPSSKLVNCLHVAPGARAKLRDLRLNLGAEWVRQEITTDLRHAGAECELFGLSLAGAGEEVDQRTLQAHAAGGIHSNLLYKNALFADARSIFSGLIRVDPGAHQTDAYQACRNLLLSEDAEANAMPGLEINADQVRCSHGSTCGQIDPEEVFYLRARGIPEAAARHLVTFGFAHDIVSRAGNEWLEEQLDARVEARLLALRGQSTSA